MVQECGFTVYAVEFGAASGRAVDAWVRGDDGDLDALITPRSDGCPGQSAEGRDTLRWLRAHNATAPHPVRFAGLDVPAAGGSLAPVLEPVARYLTDVDSGAVHYARTALELSEPLAGGSGLVPAHARLRLDPAVQDRLSAILGRLLNRVTVMREVYVENGGRQAYENALSDVWAAWRTDQMQRAMSELLGGAPDAADLAARDRYLADSLLHLIDRSAPGTRIIVSAHNAHIQRTANPEGGPLARTPMGYPLAQELGTDYVSVALTSGGGRTVANVSIRRTLPGCANLRPTPPKRHLTAWSRCSQACSKRRRWWTPARCARTPGDMACRSRPGSAWTTASCPCRPWMPTTR